MFCLIILIISLLLLTILLIVAKGPEQFGIAAGARALGAVGQTRFHSVVQPRQRRWPQSFEAGVEGRREQASSPVLVLQDEEARVPMCR